MELIKDVQENVFGKCFANGNFREGRDLLKKMYFKLKGDELVEEQRMVIYNLAWVHNQLGDKESAKLYIKNIKKIVEENKFYCKKELAKYNKLLHLYIDVCGDELSEIEIINIEEKILKNHARAGNTIGVNVAKFNIALIKKDFEGLNRSLRAINTYKLINIKSQEEIKKCEAIIDNMLRKISQVDKVWSEEICLTLKINTARFTSMRGNISGEVF